MNGLMVKNLLLFPPMRLEAGQTLRARQAQRNGKKRWEVFGLDSMNLNTGLMTQIFWRNSEKSRSEMLQTITSHTSYHVASCRAEATAGEVAASFRWAHLVDRAIDPFRISLVIPNAAVNSAPATFLPQP